VRSTISHIALVTDFNLRTLASDPDDRIPTEADLATVDDVAQLLERAYRRFEELRPTLTPERLNTVLTLRAIAVTADEAHDHFGRCLEGNRWAVLRGWHVLRHSFASNCAAAGIDQRIIDEWMGHQTEEMVRRYRHMFPDQQRKAIDRVFG
jgi:integrase